ncbi:hypothetical protein CONCODRAFT_78996 [Conidiobolus coronatus NRRL 28638]|uniref:Uncharacterized protein n=1 Tax=Conidiobolus coronatus (strain ATCC 28846 / CBS 209.66 / NRRL 28638) TaxID=796925 RepID=A0A137P543_CONC2|nr:hypothetical protein CONCODRAFT_78996 [Conidiobolus coronatus NRRL 28638]|eukprot:KXN70125.1 hypothetical protein CONCODRAFT_78996 [Conidiobolus coronatus NRRL 28638]
MYKLRCMVAGTNVEYLAATVKSTQLKRNLNVFHLMSLKIESSKLLGLILQFSGMKKL